MDELTIPANLADAAEAEGRQDWLETLPATIEELAPRWGIEVGEPFQPGGATAWVAPAANTSGGALVLKLLWPHPEAVHEADALRLWAGQGAVVLQAAEDLGHTIALLIERCQPGITLSTLPEPDQDGIIADLLSRLWIDPPPGHPFRRLEEMCEHWANQFDTQAAGGTSRLDPGLARLGIDLFRHLPATATQRVLRCTDLHAENVLSAKREPWLVIDPKPYIGDPTYDLLQHMLNCPARLHSDPLGLIHRIAELAGLDAERSGLWLFARCVQESPDWPRLAEVAHRIALHETRFR